MARGDVAGGARPATRPSSGDRRDRLRPTRRLRSDAPLERLRGAGIDPVAPDEENYRSVEFELVELIRDVDAVVASTSLHHVADPAEVIERIASTLAGDGKLVVVEGDWEAFDEPTADWCFQRLGPDEAAGWLHRRRNAWPASGHPWTAYVRRWAEEEQLHRAQTLLRLLNARFHCEHLAQGPYFFPDLARTTERDEQAAIEAGKIQATRVDYVGRLR